MSLAVNFDTHSNIKSLMDVGMSEAQAEAIVYVQVNIARNNLATRQDVLGISREIAEVHSELKSEIAEVRSELKVEVAEVRAEVSQVRSELKAEISELRADVKAEFATIRKEMAEVQRDLKTNITSINATIAETKTEIIKWLGMAIIAQGGLILAFMQFAA